MKKREVKKVASNVTVSRNPHTEEIKYYIDIIAEDFQHRVSAIAEQFLGLNEKLDSHTQRLDSLTQKLDSHTQKLDSHTQRLDSHTQMIGRIMIDVEEIKVNMREKIGRDEFNKLETRLVTLESIVLSGQGGTPKN